LDGLETTRRIRNDPRFASIPIIALTAHVLPEERKECEDAGMDDYVPKPFKPGQLRECIELWVGGASPRSAEETAPTGEASGEDLPEGGRVEQDPEEEPKLPVDLEAFRMDMRDAGIESVVEVAVQAYLEETPGRMVTLEEAVHAGDMRTVELEAHGMKSSSKNIRAHRLGDLLQEVENAGKEGRETDVQAALPKLKAAFDEVLDFLRG
jgi:CheY-like chemotaxis protein